MITYLYIKQHNETGLKYFGKTTRNPFTYEGSGLYWKKHLKKHGNDVTTTWVQAFDNIEKLNEYAIRFSEENDIVEAKDWANLKIENGLDGGRDPGFIGVEPSDEVRKARSKRMTENNPMHNTKSRMKHSKAMATDSRKQKLSNAKKNNTNVLGRSWYNDGSKTKMFATPPDDEKWVPGRLNPHWNHKRSKTLGAN